MGRHRRSAAGPAADDHAAATAGRHRGAARRKKATPVRTGLLGASAAMALGAVAVASGLVPVGDNYTLGGSSDSGRVRAGSPSDLASQQGGVRDLPSERPSAAAEPSRTPSASATPKPTPSKASPKPKPTPSKASPAPAKTKPQADKPAEKPAAKQTPTPERTTPKAPSPSRKPVAPPVRVPGESAAEAAVLTLVNQERAQAGCRPLKADPELAGLAGDFSEDMAERGFFDHTDPDGATPWDRAAKAGVTGLGAENIARGQADAKAVMDGWMNSPGHRANILNCDYKTLGVGAHFAPGGPWWTQDFGF
ncbi:CAP domain-containing protein [Streptomyces sp. SYSU K21746]